MVYGLTYLGVAHTLISLVAVAAGIVAFARMGAITWGNTVGKVYVIATVITCLTGFGIFQHGGFGKPHALGIITLIVIAVALAAAFTRVFGKLSPYVEVLSYSVTFFFHMIPGVTETTTRLPLGKPLLPSPEAPELQVVAGVLFVLLVIGCAYQVVRLRARLRGTAPAAMAGADDEAPRPA